MPSSFDHSYKYQKAPKFQVWPKGQEWEFIYDFIYLTFYSNKGISIKIKVEYEVRRWRNNEEVVED